MSERNFPVAAQGLGGEAVEPVFFTMIDFVGEPVFIHSSVGVLTWGGEDWYGLGALGSIETVRDQAGLSPTRVRLVLSAVTAEYLNSSLNENTWGRLAEIYLGVWDGESLKRDPTMLIRGRMGPPEVTISKEGNLVSVQVEDLRGLLDRSNGRRSTILDHQAESPGDTFYGMLPAMMDHKFTFNGGSFGANNVIPSPGINWQQWFNSYRP